MNDDDEENIEENVNFEKNDNFEKAAVPPANRVDQIDSPVLKNFC